VSCIIFNHCSPFIYNILKMNIKKPVATHMLNNRPVKLSAIGNKKTFKCEKTES